MAARGRGYWSRRSDPLRIAAAVFLVVIAFVSAIVVVVYVAIPWYNNNQPPVGCLPGQTKDSAGNCIWQTSTSTNTATTPTSPYYGSVSFTVSSIWGLDDSALALTNAAVKLYHQDGTTALCTLTQGTATPCNVERSDAVAGKIYVVWEYLTEVIGFIDPAKSIAKNKDYLSTFDLIDIRNTGAESLRFQVSLASLPAYQVGTVPTMILQFYSWKYQNNAVVLTTNVSPTGMTTAGTGYTASGYLGTFAGDGYQLNVQKITLVGNSTAASLSTKIEANGVTITEFLLQGIGRQSGHVYGGDWKGMQWDSANDQYVVFITAKNGIVDVSQVNWGLGMIQEKQSRADWLGWQMYITTTAGSMVTHDYYYITITVFCSDPSTATVWSETDAITLTG